MDKFQTKNSVNNTASQIVNTNDKDKIPKNNTHTQVIKMFNCFMDVLYFYSIVLYSTLIITLAYFAGK